MISRTSQLACWRTTCLFRKRCAWWGCRCLPCRARTTPSRNWISGFEPFEGSRLGYLLNGAGLFHQAHRAVDDCHALLEILAFELPMIGKPALAVLLEQARKKTMRVWAEQSPFDLKDSLKRRGYRWSDGNDGRPRSWYIDVDESKLGDEIAFLKTEIYLRDVEPRLQTLTAFDRFSVRA